MYRTSFFSTSVFAGTGIYMGVFQDNSPVFNPYVTAGVSADFQISEAFQLSLRPAYNYLITRRDGAVTSFYSSLDFSLQISVNPGSMGSGTRRPKLKINPPEFYQIFPVIYKYYDKHAIGSVTVKNSEKSKIKNILVSFYVPQYMDGPRVIAEIDEMKPNEEARIPISALFRNDILNITEKDSVQSLISVDYYAGSASLTAKRTESLRIYDRNSINWDDTRKAAAFITAKDPTILKFSRNVTSEVARNESRVINQSLSDAIAIFEALREYGITYKIDPDSSYAELSK